MNPYRKKPVVVEAVRVPTQDDDEDAYMRGHGSIAGWFFSHGFTGFEVTEATDSGNGYDLATLEGVMHADPGDWIIRGVKGEFYPCKPDIFAATHEAV